MAMTRCKREIRDALQRVTQEFGLTGEVVRRRKHPAWQIPLPDGTTLVYVFPNQMGGQARSLNNCLAELRRAISRRVSAC